MATVTTFIVYCHICVVPNSLYATVKLGNYGDYEKQS